MSYLSDFGMDAEANMCCANNAYIYFQFLQWKYALNYVICFSFHLFSGGIEVTKELFKNISFILQKNHPDNLTLMALSF